ncbi:hypothetical protein, partial [Stutzerimonas stutzeri]|uniref:hypothetical protein n=1 Tax=Stutzerimonas stutzeri TaxID=316 RepID=UPI00244CD0EB
SAGWTLRLHGAKFGHATLSSVALCMPSPTHFSLIKHNEPRSSPAARLLKLIAFYILPDLFL